MNSPLTNFNIVPRGEICVAGKVYFEVETDRVRFHSWPQPNGTNWSCCPRYQKKSDAHGSRKMASVETTHVPEAASVIQSPTGANKYLYMAKGGKMRHLVFPSLARKAKTPKNHPYPVQLFPAFLVLEKIPSWPRKKQAQKGRPVVRHSEQLK